MYHNRIAAVKIFFAPYRFEKLLSGDYIACVFAKGADDTEFNRCKVKLFTLELADVSAVVDLKT